MVEDGVGAQVQVFGDLLAGFACGDQSQDLRFTDACGCPKSCRGWSGRMFVFVDEAIAAGRSDESKGQRVASRVVVGGGVSGRSLVERTVGPVDVVMVDVVDHEPLELALIPDDRAVKELSAQGADPAFSEGVGHWDANRGAQYLETFASKDPVVEVVDELAGTVTNEGSGVGEPVGITHEEVAGGLGGPGAW